MTKCICVTVPLKDRPDVYQMVVDPACPVHAVLTGQVPVQPEPNEAAY